MATNPQRPRPIRRSEQRPRSPRWSSPERPSSPSRPPAPPKHPNPPQSSSKKNRTSVLERTQRSRPPPSRFERRSLRPFSSKRTDASNCWTNSSPYASTGPWPRPMPSEPKPTRSCRVEPARLPHRPKPAPMPHNPESPSGPRNEPSSARIEPTIEPTNKAIASTIARIDETTESMAATRIEQIDETERSTKPIGAATTHSSQ